MFCLLLNWAAKITDSSELAVCYFIDINTITLIYTKHLSL